MKRNLLFPVLLLVTALCFSACASDNPSDSNGNTPSVSKGTIKVTIDGVQKTYTTVVTTFNPSDTVIAIDAMDPETPYGRFRMFIYNPAVKSFTVEPSDRPGEVALIQSITLVGGSATSSIAQTGTVNVTKYANKEVAGTFNFVAKVGGFPNGQEVVGTNGEFYLGIL